jgi:hypothetical protein
MRHYQNDIVKLKSLITQRYPKMRILTMDGDDGSYGYATSDWFDDPKIVIKADLPSDMYLEVLAHELGHHLDGLPFNGVRARGLFYFGKHLVDDATSINDQSYRFGLWLVHRYGSIIFREEERAWELGFQFLRDNGIEIDQRLEELRRQGINWYRRYLMIKDG